MGLFSDDKKKEKKTDYAGLFATGYALGKEAAHSKKEDKEFKKIEKKIENIED